MSQIELNRYQHIENKTPQSTFDQWAKKNKVELLPELDNLKVGQMLYFVNGYDVPMVFKIVGLTKPDKYGNCIYLDWDCFWSPIGKDRIIDVLK